MVQRGVVVSSLNSCCSIVALQWASLSMSSVTLQVVIFCTYVCMSAHPLCADWPLEYDVVLLMLFVFSSNLSTKGVGGGASFL